jgi:hypothetical protein
MSEEQMVEAVQAALTDQGVDDKLVAVGQFEPRGHTGALFAGGMIGGDVGGALGEIGESVGLAAGSLGGMRANASSRGLPEHMLVGVTDTTVYGFESRSRRKEPHALVFTAARNDLEVKVHRRVNVRVLELIHEDSGSRIELEGSRLPLTHSKDVIDVLSE